MAIFTLDLVDNFSNAANSAKSGMSGLIDKFTQGIASGQGLTDVMGGLAGSVDPVSLVVKVAVTELLMFAAAAATVGAAVIGLMGFAIEAVGENEKMIASFEALIGNGEETVNMLDNLSKQLPFTKDELGKFAQGLASAGIKGQELELGTKAVAASYAMLGDKGSAAMTKLITKLQTAADSGKKITNLGPLLKNTGVFMQDVATSMGMSLDKFNQKVKAGAISAKELQKAVEDAAVNKAGPAFERMGLQFKNIWAKATQAFGDMFEQLKEPVDAFMTEVKKLFEVFSAGEGSSKAFGGVVKAVFTDLFKIATMAVVGIRHGIDNLIIGFSKVAIFVAPVVKAIWNFAHSATGLAILNGALSLLKYLFIGLAAVIGIIVVTMIAALTPIAMLIGAIIAVVIALGAAIAFVIKIIISLGSSILSLLGIIYDFAASAISALAGWASGAVDAAGNFISGLVQGITNGAGAVIAAVTGVASGAVDAVKSFLGIASPSKVMIGLGVHTAKGMALGIDSGADQVANSSANLASNSVSSASMNLSDVGAKQDKATKGGININVGGINITGVGSSGEALALTEQQIALIFDRLALEYGL